MLAVPSACKLPARTPSVPRLSRPWVLRERHLHGGPRLRLPLQRARGPSASPSGRCQRSSLDFNSLHLVKPDGVCMSNECAFLPPSPPPQTCTKPLGWEVAGPRCSFCGPRCHPACTGLSKTPAESERQARRNHEAPLLWAVYLPKAFKLSGPESHGRLPFSRRDAWWKSAMRTEEGSAPHPVGTGVPLRRAQPCVISISQTLSLLCSP